jgi:hypothetical protein
VLAAAVPALVLLAVPLSRETTCLATSEAGGATACATRNLTFAESQGTGAALVLLVPTALAAVPLVVRGRAAGRAVAALLVAGALVSIASVGAWFAPAAAAACWAASAPRIRPSPSPA